MSVLGVYKREAFQKTLRVGTPDPSRYHDARSVRLEGAQEAPLNAKIPPNTKFALPGVVIPHAKREGGSMGWNSEADVKVFIDPEQTGGQIQIDIGDIRRNPQAMTDAIKDAFATNVEHEDAIVEAFARFAKPMGAKKQPSQTVNVYEHPQEPEMPREAPLQMRGTYVVPKSTPGGSQLKAASFTKKPEIQELPQEHIQATPVQNVVPEISNVKIAAAIRQAKSLHEELAGPAISLIGGSSRPMRKITFELPLAGQSNTSLGQFVCYYSDVICDDFNLVLVNDNSNPGQVTWYPPPIDDPQSGEPMGIAVLVHGIQGESDTLYLAFPTGVKFTYRSETFCLLTIDKKKSYKDKV